MSGAREYLWGQDRNDDAATAHAYECDGPMNPIKPMCIYGWNRAGGYRFSILRNVVTGATCKTCEKRMAKGLAGVDPTEHKTRWL